MIKLVALDLDGTVVNEALQISPRTLAVLNTLIHDTDVRVVIATGRMHLSALPYATKIGTPEPVVTYQGAMTRTQGVVSEILDHRPIPMAFAQGLVKDLAERGLGMNLYVNDHLYTNHHDEVSTLYAKLAGIQPVYTASLADMVTDSPSKLMVIQDEGIEDLLLELRRDYDHSLNFCLSRKNFLEIIDISASKWNAVHGLAQRWGICPEEIMAIGDQENDLSMILNAGVGVAMGNAPQVIKEQANYVTASIEEDGVAQAIDKFILAGGMPLADIPGER